MTKQLPMATNPPIPLEQCNFELIELPPEHRIHACCLDFVIETNHKLIDPSVVYLLGISHEWCTTYIGGEDKYTKCQISQGFDKGFHGRYGTMSGITLEQLNIIWAKAQNNRAVKFKPVISELILTKVMPLFNSAVAQTNPIEIAPKIELNPVKANQPLTMSSQEMANITNTRHDSVKRTIETLQNKGLISFTQIVENPESKGGRPKTVYHVNKRDSYVVVAQLSPEFTADLVDRWQELENQLAGGVPQISIQPVATAPALPSAKDLALMVIKSEEEKEQLQRSYNFLGDELCQAIREKAQIGSKREASALGKLARANDKLKLRDEKICQLEAKLSSPVSEYEYATILAVQSRLKYIKVSGLKLTYFCNRNGLVIKDIPDDRYGAVHSYPAQAWRDVYQIDINAVLNKVA